MENLAIETKKTHEFLNPDHFLSKANQSYVGADCGKIVVMISIRLIKYLNSVR